MASRILDDTGSHKGTLSHLGRGIVGRPAAGLQEVAVTHHVAEPKVRDLHVAVRVQQQVLRLQVSVHHLRVSAGPHVLCVQEPSGSASSHGRHAMHGLA
jgi:hypothetical protein